jgi:Zn-dependent peptidase ImmA (M78 family)
MDEMEAQQRARQFISPLDLSAIRADLGVYLRAVGAKVISESLGSGQSGTTMMMPNGKHVITVNENEIEERQRFTICHEIAHIVLGLPSSHAHTKAWSYAKRDPNEILCDLFAAELLMPYTLWQKTVPECDPSHDCIVYMAEEFCCSYHSAASRYASLAKFPCAMVTMERDIIRHAARSTSLRSLGAWISPRTTVPEGSIAHTLRQAGVSTVQTGSVSQDIWFQDWESGFDLAELSRHYASTDTTISLLWFEGDESPVEETDRFGGRVEESPLLAELTGDLPWPGRSRRR